MSKLIDDFRRNHPVQPAKPSRVLSRCLAALGGLVVVSFLMLQVVAVLTYRADTVAVPVQDSTRALAPQVSIAGTMSDDLVTGSLTRAAGTVHGDPSAVVPLRAISIAGWGVLAGALVFLSLNYAINTGSTPAGDPTNSRLPTRTIHLQNDNRRQGGPIRN